MLGFGPLGPAYGGAQTTQYVSFQLSLEYVLVKVPWTINARVVSPVLRVEGARGAVPRIIPAGRQAVPYSSTYLFSFLRALRSSCRRHSCMYSSVSP